MTDNLIFPNRLTLGNEQSEGAQYYGQYLELREDVSVHWHNFYEIDFVISGKGTQRINGTAYPFEAGSLSVLSDSDFHGYEISADQGPMKVYCFHFSDSFLDEITMARLRSLAGQQLSCQDAEEYVAMVKEFETIISEVETDTPERDEFVRNTLARIILLIVRNHRDKAVKDEGCEELSKELLYLDKHFREHITEEDVARHTGVSTAYFSKLFRKRYGVTFQNYLLNKRLQWAYGLIRSSNLPVTAICFEAGFNSHNYFSRRFKMRYGMTPMAVRQLNRKENFK